MFIDHASCTLTAQVLKEYEKTISELIADKERDKKALEAEVQLFSLTMDSCFHGNLAFTCFLTGVEDAAGEGAGSGRSSGEQRHWPLLGKKSEQLDTFVFFL